MRRLAVISFLAISWVTSAFGQVDSTTAATLGAKLDGYYAAICTEPVSVQNSEVDFLIGSCEDSLVRQFVALHTYSHYMESKIMGVEAVAIHIFDKWFSDGKVSMAGEADLFAARLFAELNRNTLLGCTAPSTKLIDLQGNEIRIPAAISRPSILFFYDTDCSKCKIESIVTNRILENGDYPVDLFAIYVGGDRQKWEDFIPSLSPEMTRGNVRHLMLAPGSEEASISWGLVQTPRIFLTDRNAVITGRGLDSISLDRLLKRITEEKDYSYGSDQSKAMYDKVFDTGTTLKTINMVADHIAKRTLASGDTTLFRHMTGDLLYYLSSKRREPYISGCAELIDRYITGTSGIWTGGDDSLKVVGLARMLSDLYSKAPEGSKVPKVTLEGTLHCRDVQREWGASLRKLKGKETYIIFHTRGCPVCAAEMNAADSLVRASGGNIQVLDIDMDALFTDKPEMASAAMDAFDLSELPQIIHLDRKAIVRKRYVSLQ